MHIFHCGSRVVMGFENSRLNLAFEDFRMRCVVELVLDLALVVQEIALGSYKSVLCMKAESRG